MQRSPGYKNHPPQLPNQVYCFSPATGEVRCVADGFAMPNGSASVPSSLHALQDDPARRRLQRNEVLEEEDSRLTFSPRAQSASTTPARSATSPTRAWCVALFRSLRGPLASPSLPPRPISPTEILELTLFARRTQIAGDGSIHPQRPSTIYAYDVVRPDPARGEDAHSGPRLEGRRVFAYVDCGVPCVSLSILSLACSHWVARSSSRIDEDDERAGTASRRTRPATSTRAWATASLCVSLPSPPPFHAHRAHVLTCAPLAPRSGTSTAPSSARSPSSPPRPPTSPRLSLAPLRPSTRRATAPTSACAPRGGCASWPRTGCTSRSSTRKRSGGACCPSGPERSGWTARGKDARVDGA